MNRPAKVLIVDDHEVITEALSALLKVMPEVKQCTAVSSLREARQIMNKLQPDLVLLDITLPDGSGDDLITEIKESLPHCRIMLMSGQFKPGQLAQLSRLSADGIFSKTDSFEQLQEGLNCLLDGEPYVSSEVRTMLNAAGQGRRLSPRQMEILKMVSTGTTNKEIANLTKLTPSTVAFHLRESRLRLGVKTTREAVKLAHEIGMF